MVQYRMTKYLINHLKLQICKNGVISNQMVMILSRMLGRKLNMSRSS